MNKKILDVTARRAICTSAFCICLTVAANIQESRVEEAGAFGHVCVFPNSFTTESDEEPDISRNEVVRVTNPGEAAAEGIIPAGLASPADGGQVETAAIQMPADMESSAAEAAAAEVAAVTPEQVYEAAPELTGGPELLEGAPQQFYQNRWGIITLTEDEKELLARILWLEARGEPETGREAVVEVIFNRIASNKYPNTVYDVLSQKNPVQFSSWKDRERAVPGEAEYQTIENVLNGNTGILRDDTLYFSRSPLTSRVDARIGAHSFCY